MDMVEKVARAIAGNDAWGALDERDRHGHLYAARAAIAAMSEELLAHFQSAVDSPALTSVEKYRVSVCMDDIRHLTGAEVK